MGDWKLLLPWGKSTIVETVVGAVLEAGLEALVVAGYRGDELHALLDGRPGVQLVDNPEWRQGMLGSILSALDLVRAEAFFVTPADMPMIGSGIYRLLTAEARSGAKSRSHAYFAACGGIPGHPVLIPRDRIPAMKALDRGGKLRPFLMEGPWCLVETGEAAVHADIDSPADFEAARQPL
jgi:molybdenum cofactor cytidylyltransferase